MDKYNAAYINALSEERDPALLFEWVCKLHRENVDLKEKISRLEGRNNTYKNYVMASKYGGEDW